MTVFFIENIIQILKIVIAILLFIKFRSLSNKIDKIENDVSIRTKKKHEMEGELQTLREIIKTNDREVLDELKKIYDKQL